MRSLMDAAAAFDPAVAVRDFRVVMSDYVTAVFLPLFMQRMSAEAPQLSLTVENIGPASFSRLAAGEVDLCVTTDDLRVINEGERNAELVSAILFEDDFVAVACARNDRAGDGMSVEDFCSLPHVLTQFGIGARTLEEISVERAGLRYRARVCMPGFGQVLGQLPNTDCVALVQRRLAERSADALGLKVFDPPISVPRLREALIWHPRYDFDPGHAWVRQLAITTGRDITAATGPKILETEPVVESRD